MMSNLTADLALTGRLLRRAAPHRGILLGTFASMMLAAATESAPIALAKVFVDRVLLPPGEDAETSWLGDRVLEGGRSLSSWFGVDLSDPRLGALLWVVAGVLLVGALGAVATFANTFFGRLLAARVVSDLRSSLVTKVLSLPLSRFQDQKRGDLLSRFSNDVQVTHVAVNLFLMVLTLQPLVMVFAASAAFYLNWRLALASLVLLPAVVVAVGRIGRRVSRRSRESLVSLGESTETLHQIIAGHRVIKAFRREAEEVARYQGADADWFARQIRLIRTKALGRSVTALAYTLTIAMVLGVGGWLVVGERWGLDAATLTAFLLALATIYRPASRMARAFGDWQESMAAARRLFEVLDEAGELPVPAGGARIGPLGQSLEFEHVSFAYSGESGASVFEDFSLRIPKGRSVALVGPSGAGKSTLFDLILGLQKPSRGRILFDGVDISTVAAEDLVQHIALVDQHPFLFRSSVRDNIAYGRPDATDAEIEAAARAAHVHDVILQLPRGYQTLVGERGERLSGGERQRITIARAILKDASLLLLDEPTSSLDSHSESAVQQALAVLLEGRTSILIAHRLSTAARAEEVLVLDQGKIVERGPPADLLRREGPYARLYQTQQVR